MDIIINTNRFETAISVTESLYKSVQMKAHESAPAVKVYETAVKILKAIKDAFVLAAAGKKDPVQDMINEARYKSYNTGYMRIL